MVLEGHFTVSMRSRLWVGDGRSDHEENWRVAPAIEVRTYQVCVDVRV